VDYNSESENTSVTSQQKIHHRHMPSTLYTMRTNVGLQNPICSYYTPHRKLSDWTTRKITVFKSFMNIIWLSRKGFIKGKPLFEIIYNIQQSKAGT